MESSTKNLLRFLLIAAILFVVSFWGPGLIMDALSYTPPGVQPPKGLEKRAKKSQSAQPCAEDGELFVSTSATASLYYSPCYRLTLPDYDE